MAKPVEKLVTIHYEILSCLKRRGSLTREQLSRHLSSIDAFDIYLSQLLSAGYVNEEMDSWVDVLGRAQFRMKNIFYISNTGKKALQDYKNQRKENNRDMWKEKALIPIIVAIATTILLNLLAWLLLPITRWFHHFL